MDIFRSIHIEGGIAIFPFICLNSVDIYSGIHIHRTEAQHQLSSKLFTCYRKSLFVPAYAVLIEVVRIINHPVMRYVHRLELMPHGILIFHPQLCFKKTPSVIP